MNYWIHAAAAAGSKAWLQELRPYLRYSGRGGQRSVNPNLDDRNVGRRIAGASVKCEDSLGEEDVDEATESRPGLTMDGG